MKLELRCNGMKDPIGIAKESILFTWKLKSEILDVIQEEVRFQLADTETFLKTEFLYEKRISGRDPFFRMEQGKEITLKENKQYFWRISLVLQTSEGERETGFCKPGLFVTAYKTGSKWNAKWIEAEDAFYKDGEEEQKKYWKTSSDLGFWNEILSADKSGSRILDQGLQSVPCFRRVWNIKKDAERVTIRISARGFYELRINGVKIGRCALTPDFTPYDKQIYYQTYDVTEQIRAGENMVEICLGDGWFCGHAQGVMGRNHLYGKRPAVIMEGIAEWKDGSRQTLESDRQFECYTTPWIYADLFMGERIDFRRKEKRYFTVEKNYETELLIPQCGECIEVVDVLKAQTIKRTDVDKWLIDFGQVIAGREALRLRGAQGTTVKIEHCEVLRADGTLYNPIPEFPFHDQTNYVTFSEEQECLYVPKFSFQGFRYLLLTGLTEELDREDCQAEVISTAMEENSWFWCDDKRMNQLVSNIKWSQRGNMLSIPTDCPQRERAGFTGDAQVFIRAATWNQNVRNFFVRWLSACRKEQLSGGQIPIVVPYTEAYREAEPNPGWTSAGWGDAIVWIPWVSYQVYDDRSVLKENYDAMQRWLEYEERCANETMPEKYYHDFVNRRRQKYLWNTGFHWGDWLIPGMSNEEGTKRSKEIIASLFYFRTVFLMAKISSVLGKKEETERYRQLAEQIRNAFREEYIVDKHLGEELQGLYVLAVAFQMVTGEDAKIFAKRLNELVMENGYCLQTGFLSTPYLLDVLWDYGYVETANQVLFQEKCPSWLYEVKQGATTVWEEWDGITADMEYKASSFNHYAFGCVCDFIYRKIGGLTSLERGFRKIQIRPEMVGEIAECRFQYESIYGKIKIHWKRIGEQIEYELEIPPNTTAVVYGKTEIREIGSGYYSERLN